MFRTLKTRALIACLVTMGVTIAIGTTSILLKNRLTSDLDQTNTIATALRNHTIGDMAHDGLRSVVYAALAAQELKTPREAVSKNLEEMVAKINKVIGDNKALDLSKEIRTALTAVEEPLKEYVAVAQRVVDLAFTKRPDAIATLPDFNDKFTALERALEEVGNGIQATAEEVNKQADAFAATATTIAISALGVGIVMSGMLTAFVLLGMLRPLGSIEAAMRELASGNFAVVLPGLERKDEIGEMARAVETFKIKAAEKAQQEAEEKRAEEARVAAQRRADMLKLADEFQRVVGGIVETVSSASTELESTAGTLTNTAETTQQLSTITASASEEASSNVQSVASATEELGSSVNEIARQVQESSRIAAEAVKQAAMTDARINELSGAASRIGDVVKLITAIAEQTNLLALNATIEAARAGEAGRGFAVVAQEVKALAAQTAKATDEISTQIAGMQTATQDSVAAMKEIGSTINRISEIASTIAAAVEEQGAATQEIARNVQEAAQGTAQVAQNIGDVNKGAAETGSASSQVLSSAQSLSSESSRLKIEVDKFLNTVRAA